MENTSIQIARQVRTELAPLGVSDTFVEKIVQEGWTLTKVQEAKDIALEHKVRFQNVVRWHDKMGIPMDALGDLLTVKQEHPDFTMPQLRKCWDLCVPKDKAREEDRAFFEEFLDAADGIVAQAQALKSAVTRSPNFILGRLIEYITEANSGDIERVFREMLDEPEELLDRILGSSKRGLDHGASKRTITGRDDAWRPDDPIDLVDIHDDEEEW